MTRHERARAEHDRWLRRMGLRTTRPRLRGVPPDDLTVRSGGTPRCSAPLSDSVPGAGHPVRPGARVSGVTIGPSFNKGPLQVITRSELRGTGKYSREE